MNRRDNGLSITQPIPIEIQNATKYSKKNEIKKIKFC